MGRSEATGSDEFVSQRGQRLESWKEIASYLKKDLRTVQRWERREGLPVHRHLHDRISTVYAFKTEIDQWQSQRIPKLAEATLAGDVATAPAGSMVSGSSPVAGSPSTLGKRISGVTWATAVASVAVLILVSLYVIPKSHPNRPAKLAHDGSRLIVKGSNDSVLWTVPLAHPLTEYAPAVIADLDGDGQEEVLACTQFAAGPSDPPVFRSGELHCFTTSGKPLWRFSLNDNLRFGTHEFGPPWVASYWLFNGEASRPIVGIALHHFTWWPSVLVLLDGRGQVVGKFTNAGWFESLKWLPRPSGALILAGGISHSRSSAILAVLDAKQSSGSSPEDSGSEYECKNCADGKPLRYFVFPRSELNSLMLSQHHSVVGLSTFRDGFTVHTEEVATRLPGTTETFDAVYEFSLDLELKTASYSDRYWGLHRRLEAEGKIKHSAAECPERHGPTGVRAWDPKNGWRDLHPAGLPAL